MCTSSASTAITASDPKVFPAGSGFLVVEPSFGKDADLALHANLRLTRRPQLELCGLGSFGVCAGDIDYHDIERLGHIGGRGHASAMLLKLAVIEVQTRGVIARLRKRLQARDDHLTRRKPEREGVSAIELCGVSILRPDGQAKATVAHRHRLPRLLVWRLQNDVGTLDDPLPLDVEVALVPRCGRLAGLCPRDCSQKGEYSGEEKKRMTTKLLQSPQTRTGCLCVYQGFTFSAVDLQK
jgi:hypothetical protein